MRVAVIGAGVAGLTAALRLAQQGHEPVVYERWPGLGGQAATLDVGQGHLLERYYHHWFSSDRHVIGLCEELGLDGDIAWGKSTVAFFSGGRSWPFTTPLDLLRFGPLGLVDRVRLGLGVLSLQRHSDVAGYERTTAREWIERRMGLRAWVAVWGPLLRAKFGDRAEDISMGWLWSKLTVRRRLEGKEARGELLGYPQNSFEPLFTALRDAIESAGGRVVIDRPAARIARAPTGGFLVTPGAAGSFRTGHDPRAFTADGEPEAFDAVLATVPNDVFAELLDPELVGALAPGYDELLAGVEYRAALCLLLELDRRFSPFYWTNIGEEDLPFIGLIEHTNLIDPGRYDGRRFLYVANYLAPDDPLMALSADELLEHCTPGLKRVNPAFDPSWVRARWLHREPAGQPVVTVGYAERIPPLDTGVPGLVLANTTQIYPEDRGTNYAVRLGEDAVAALLATAREAERDAV